MGRPRGSSVLYKDIAKRLLNRIHKGKWQDGMTLPSYSELAEDFNTSQHTILRVLEPVARYCQILWIGGEKKSRGFLLDAVHKADTVNDLR